VHVGQVFKNLHRSVQVFEKVHQSVQVFKQVHRSVQVCEHQSVQVCEEVKFVEVVQEIVGPLWGRLSTR